MLHRNRLGRQFVLASLAMALLGLGLRAQEAQPRVLVVVLEDQILQPITERFVINALRHGAGNEFQCVILQLDTPGGTIESVDHIVKEILTCNVPVIVYITPSGARARSAGIFVVLAAHLSAMAPGTNIGPAQPMWLGPGPWPGLNDPDLFGRNGNPPPLADKKDIDAADWARALAELRGRNADWAGRVFKAGVASGPTEALSERVVNIVAKDLSDLLDQLDGRKIDLIDQSVVMRTRGAAIERLEMSWSERLLSLLANPTIAYMILLGGFAGFALELTHPGAWVPGILGVVCVLLFLVATQLLPINYAGLALIFLGFLLMLVELKFHTYGLMTVAGIVLLLVGSAILIDTAGGVDGVSWLIVAPVTISVGLVVALLVSNVIRSRRTAVQTGVQGLVGTIARVKGDMDREGYVFVAGELWKARSEHPLQDGEAVRIQKIDGLTLYVKPTI